jgi:hypothetical protein
LNEFNPAVRTLTQRPVPDHWHPALALEAIQGAFGASIDYVLLIKLYGQRPGGEKCYRRMHLCVRGNLSASGKAEIEK